MLNITTTKASLKAALDAVTRIVEAKNTIPVLSNVLLDPVAKTLKATDLDIEAIHGFEMDGGGEGVTLPARLLADIAGKLPDGAAISITLGDADRAILKSGRSRFTLATLPAQDFPDLSGLRDEPTIFTLPAATLALLFNRTSFAISTEETRYYLNGIHMHPVALEAGGYALRAVATDGHRLALSDSGTVEGVGGMPPVIVPRKTVGEIQRALGKAGKDATIEVAVTKNRIRFAMGSLVLSSKLIDGTFPDYQRIIPARNPISVTVDSDELAAAIDRVSTISSERGRAAKFEFRDDKLKLSVNNPDAGSSEEEIAAEIEGGADITIGFNVRYALDIIAALDCEAVTFKMDNPGAPTLMLPGREAGDFLTIIMPMRV